MKKFVIIVAGGTGERMGNDIPKQFIEINGLPLLMHTFNAFYRYDKSIKFILVLNPLKFHYWDELCKKHAFTIEHTIVAGGPTRFSSVKNGVAALSDEGIVAIHDGVRPFVSTDTIARCFEAAEQYGNAIPVIPMIDTVRMVEGHVSVAIDRTTLRCIQTPQVFSCHLIKEAYKQNYMPEFTDDARVLENRGHKIHLVEGNVENIKITTPLDLFIAPKVLEYTTKLK